MTEEQPFDDGSAAKQGFMGLVLPPEHGDAGFIGDAIAELRQSPLRVGAIMSLAALMRLGEMVAV